MLKIKQAIVSVSDKTNLNILSDYFVKNRVKVLSSGGTYKFLKKINSNLDIHLIEDLTKFKEILDGRVKTLHPKIHAGILSNKKNPNHAKQLRELEITTTDLVVVNLYPFEKNSEKFSSFEKKCIESIDIGGPAMIRGAAKNFENVAVLTSPNQYKSFVKYVEKNNNSISLKERRKFATVAFEHTAYYDSLIANWFRKNDKLLEAESSSIPLKKINKLRYGENPHQKASVYSFGKNEILKLSGKDLSYNNICDLEIAVDLAHQFSNPACVIVKHGNPCGVAINKSVLKAYENALKTDPISAFGGIVAFNKTLNFKTAEKILKLFTEVVIAPNFETEAMKLLSTKKNLIIIKYKQQKKNTNLFLKTTQNFLLIQERDNKIVKPHQVKQMTKTKINKKNMDDMIFGFIVAKYINSNAIVLIKDFATVGIGCGQTNRLDSSKLAIKHMKKNFKNTKAVLASDGFFFLFQILLSCALKIT